MSGSWSATGAERSGCKTGVMAGSGGPDDDQGLHTEARFRALISGISDLILLLAPDGRVLFATPRAERAFGVQADSVLDPLAFVHPDDHPSVLATFSWLLAHPGGADDAPEMDPIVLHLHYAGTEEWRTSQVRGRNLIADPDVNGILLTLRDITEAREREALAVAGVDLLERVARGAPMLDAFAALAELQARWLPDAVSALGVVDAYGNLRVVARGGLAEELAVILEEVGSQSPVGRATRSSPQPVVHRSLGHSSDWGAAGTRFAAQGINANWAWTLRDEDDELIGVLGLFLQEDRAPTNAESLLFAQMAHLAAIIVQRHRVEAAMAHHALHDALTGLPNRALLVDRVEQAVALAARHGHDAAVLFCDLDRFKVVNDSLGHPAGDLLLQGVARRWQTLLRGGDTVGRFGGDEFLVVCNGVHGRAGAAAVARRLIDALAEPFEVEDVEVVAGVSIGIALVSAGHGEAADQLIRAADVAMYEAKRQGGGAFAVFDGNLRTGTIDRLQLEADLRRGIPGDEMEVHYQPIVRASDLVPVGVEALVRWRRPGHGVVLPGDFVDVAEETGMIAPLGSWVLREVLRQAALWQDDPALGRLNVSTNVSVRQLSQPGLVDEVAVLLDEFGVEAGRLGLEVTESALADDPSVLAEAIDRLAKLGVRVALDDFGAGFTSMDYARRFAAMSALKIDRQFVDDLESPDGHAEAVVAAMVVLGHGLDAAVVAEGVESEAQLERLRDLGCDLVQGYLLARPMPADALAEWIRAR